MKRQTSTAQEKLIGFLLAPHSYPHNPKRVHLVQTHASYVFFCFPYVYKIKKKVNFGFLDFSSLQKRQYYSRREVVLNRRLCPELYLGVAPISLTAGKLTFGKGERVIEYAVKMRKLPDRYFMLRLLDRNQVTTEDLDRIVSRLRDFYQAQAPTQKITRWGRIEKLKISTDENFAQTRSFIGLTITKPAFETIVWYTSSFYTRNSGLFRSRVRGGWIRDCHGDLHLEHVHLAPETLSIYDCIEFNDRFRYIDIASDVAFLAMDFDYHDRPDLSWQISARMAEALGDSQMLRLVDFYKCYRAYIRGKVESLHQARTEIPEGERRGSRLQAERYFRLALRYAVCGSKPTALIVMGSVASGKSTLAGGLGSELGFEVVSSDRVRKELAGVPLYKRGSLSARQRLYAEAMTTKTYKALFQRTADQFDRHTSLILDATFSSRQHRKQLHRLLALRGANYLFIEAWAPEEVVRRRLKEREEATQESSDARLEDFEMLKRSYEAPSEVPAAHRIRIATDQPTAITIAKTLKELARRHPADAAIDK
jgi:uncharacterized protein